MSSGLMSGEKIRSAFREEHGIGTRLGGVICEPDPYTTQRYDFDSGEPMFWDDERKKPREHTVVTVQTDLREGPDDDGVPDDGRRRIYIRKPGDLAKVTIAAIRKAGAKDFEIGGTYFVTRTGKDAPKKKGAKGAWLHKAEYNRPGPSSGLTTKPAKSAPVDDDSEPPF